MAYPSKLDANAILDATIDFLETEGSEALTLRRLASAIGVTANAIYRYFRNLDVLIAAAADAVAHRLWLFVEESMSALPSELSVEERVRRLLTFHMTFAAANSSLYDILLNAKREAEAELPEPRWRGKLFRQSVQIIAPLVAHEDAEAATLALWSLMHGLWGLRRAGVLADIIHEGIEGYAFVALIEGLSASKAKRV